MKKLLAALFFFNLNYLNIVFSGSKSISLDELPETKIKESKSKDSGKFKYTPSNKRQVILTINPKKFFSKNLKVLDLQQKKQEEYERAAVSFQEKGKELNAKKVAYEKKVNQNAEAIKSGLIKQEVLIEEAKKIMDEEAQFEYEYKNFNMKMQQEMMEFQGLTMTVLSDAVNKFLEENKSSEISYSVFISDFDFNPREYDITELVLDKANYDYSKEKIKVDQEREKKKKEAASKKA